MNKILSFTLVALVFASCQDSGNRSLTDPVPSGQSIFTTPQRPIADSNKQVTTSTPATTVPTATTTVPSATPGTKITAKSSGTLSLNPAHGAPGHRCDIAVGAPLNSPAISMPPASFKSNPAPAVNPAPVQQDNKSVRINPAHGAPGHDCAIPVGQPLKSK